MTLYRQLLFFTFVLFFLLLVGTWMAKLNSTRTFLLDQLESHAQDTATSLGLSISPYIQKNDMAAVETMFNAVSDRGYYRTVRLVDINNETLIDRTLTVRIEGVPQWFIKLVPLATPRASAIVLSGWSQAGKVIVESHPGYAYKTLWETVVRTSLWFLIMGIVAFVSEVIGLRLLLKPLVLVERQAEALCRRQYEIQDRLPRTRELRRVVEAMNRMTNKVKEMFNEQASIAERLRRNAYHDSLTGLGNRRYLDGQVSTRINRGDSTVKGSLLLLQVNDLQEINKQKGFQTGDAILQEVSRIIQKETDLTANRAIARLTGGDFGIFLPDISIEDTRKIAQNLVTGLQQISQQDIVISDNIGHVGGIFYDNPTSFGQLLSGADTALRAAQHEGKNRWNVNRLEEEFDASAKGQLQWKDILLEVLESGDITLFAQPTVNAKDLNKKIHLEIFSRIKDEKGKILSAGLFVPLAEQLDLIASLDRLVLEKAMATNIDSLGVDTLAVNVSPLSLKDENFRNWVLNALKRLSPKAPRLSFEFSEFSAVQHMDLIRSFGSAVQNLGHSYGLDHFGQGFSNFGYLKSLRPDYVKIDRAYTNELKNRESDSHFFIGSLTGVAHSLDIMVIAEGVEKQEQSALLQELNLDAIQGYLIGRPEPIQT